MMKNAVLILGAGASVDYGFPTGLELGKKIEDSGEWVGFKERLFNNWGRSGLGSKPSYIHGFNSIEQRFFGAGLDQIDSWLAKGSNDECVGAAKLLIAFFIAEKENPSFTRKEFFRAQYYPEKSQDSKPDWYKELFQVLVTKELKDFPRSKDTLTIVTFNYDRSLEFYFLETMQRTYNKPAIECWNQLAKLNIKHVYGNVGDLPVANEAKGVPYGSKNPEDYGNRIKNLQLIPESRDKKDETISFIRGKLKKAQTIFFIGFSYDESNLTVLGFPIKSENFHVDIYGSVYKMKVGEIKKAQKMARIIDKVKSFEDVNVDAYTFFRQIIKSHF